MSSEDQDQGASLAATGLSPTVEPVPVSPPDGASIPSAIVDQIREQTIEEIIGWVSEPSFREVQGILGRRKRTREDAALRGEAIREERAAIIAMIRGRKANRVGSVMETLSDIRDGNFGRPRGISHWNLLEAVQLAERGLVKLSVELCWSHDRRDYSPESRWTATLTPKGLGELEFASGMSAGTAETQGGSGPQDRQPGPQGTPDTDSHPGAE